MNREPWHIRERTLFDSVLAYFAVANPAKIQATTFSKRARFWVMLGRLNNFLRTKRRGILIASSAVALLIAFTLIYEPSSPDGVYYDECIACGHGCWIFKDGKISAQCEDGPPENTGTYYKSGNQWAWGNNPTNIIVIKPSLFGVKVICKQFQRGQQFWPRDSLSWMTPLIDFKDSVLSQLFR